MLPLSGDANPPLFTVPTQTNLVMASAKATAPVTFNWGFGNPDLESTSKGNNAFGSFAEPEVTSGVWYIQPALIGPIGTPIKATVDTGMAANTRIFDPTVTTKRGDATRPT